MSELKETPSDFCEFCGGHKQIECKCCTNCRALKKRIAELEGEVAEAKHDKAVAATEIAHLRNIEAGMLDTHTVLTRDRVKAEAELDKLRELARAVVDTVWNSPEFVNRMVALAAALDAALKPPEKETS